MYDVQVPQTTDITTAYHLQTISDEERKSLSETGILMDFEYSENKMDRWPSRSLY